MAKLRYRLYGLCCYTRSLHTQTKNYVSGHGAFDGIPLFEASSCLSEARYKDIFTKRLQDKNYRTYGVSCAWTLASLRAVRKLNKNAKRVKTPVPLFQAGSDTTVKPGGQSTVFPQPLGISQTWDKALMKKIGSVIGDEGRVYYEKSGRTAFLTLWFPTIDMERDPRWGRNEEAYGEDPHLAGSRLPPS